MNLMYKQKSIFSKADLFLEKVARKFQVRYFSHFQKLLFSKIKFDGSEIVPISKKYYGSGHPSMCFNDRYLLSDAYPNEIVANSNGTVPLRLIDTQKDTLDVLIELETKRDFNGVSNEWRIDPHPAFSRQFDRVVFNAKKDGVRKVFIMDLKLNENFTKSD